MKRMIASRKLKRKCDRCGKGFAKGDVFYHERKVWTETIGIRDEVFAYNYTECAPCKYKHEDHMLRYGEFITTGCKHPSKFIEMQYRYIPGEAVMEPSHEECALCHSII